MEYYCHECRQLISEQEYYFSMNRYHKALCRTHQRSSSIKGPTKDLQELVRSRHSDELTKETPQLKTIKDWIAADFETWKKALENEGMDSYVVKGGAEKKKGCKK